MLRHRGFSAWIQAEGKVIPEYLVAVDETTHRVSCWIAGKEGQAFSVYWQDEGGTIDTCSFIILDGLVVPGRFLFGAGMTSRSGVRTSMSTERPFIFQKVEDHPGSKTSSPTTAAPKEAGMIVLKIKRVKRLGTRPPNRIEPVPRTTLGKRKVGDLCIGFGEELRVDEQSDKTYDLRNHENPEIKKPSSFVTFIFRYRSPEFMESQGIIVDEPRVPITPSMSVPVTPLIAFRRISASLPPVIRPGLAEESEESEPELDDSFSGASPTKRPKLEPYPESTFPTTDSETLFPERTLPFPTTLRRPSAELRRAASWTATVPVPTKDGTYRGDGEFFLPRHNRDWAAQAGLPYLADFQDMIAPTAFHYTGSRTPSLSKIPQHSERQAQSSQGSSSSNSTETASSESPTTEPDDSFTLIK